MIPTSPWALYPKKLVSAIENPKYVGRLSAGLAEGKEMRYEEIQVGSLEEGMRFTLFLIVDSQDGVIADIKFSVFGPSVLIGILDVACHYLMRKQCAELGKVTADMLEKRLEGELPVMAHSYLNVVIDACDALFSRVEDLAFVERETPVMQGAEQAVQYPGWESLPKEERIAVIEEVIDKEIRPYVEMDEGGVQVVDLIDGKELIISYQGACTTCYSATGSTLNAIQGILRQKVSPDLKVTPDSSIF